ncbi:MAG: hypothetical protein RL161_671 [Bacteroidota bacterium]
MDSRTIYEEEIYKVKEAVTLVLPYPLSKVNPEGKVMLQNLANALKSSPAPDLICLTESELQSLATLPPLMVLFGHRLQELKPHLPSTFRSSRVTLTQEADSLVGDAEAKKELWAAIRLMLAQKD